MFLDIEKLRKSRNPIIKKIFDHMYNNDIDISNYSDFTKKLSKPQKRAMLEDICYYCQVYNGYDHQIGGIDFQYCLSELTESSFPNLNKNLLIAHSYDKPDTILGWIFCKFKKCYDIDIVLLEMVCVNNEISNNKSFRYLMGLTLCYVKIFHNKLDILLEVANTNYDTGDDYGSMSVGSPLYNRLKSEQTNCQRVGGSTVKGPKEMDEFMKKSGYYEKYKQDKKLERQAMIQRELMSYPSCPLSEPKKLFIKKAEAADRLVCNYNRWGFLIQPKRAQDLECTKEISPYIIMINPITQYKQQIFFQRILQLIQRKRKRLKINRDMDNRCRHKKYGTENIEKSDELLY